VIYEIREIGTYHESTMRVGYTLTATRAVEAAERHVAEFDHPVEVLRHRPVEDWVGLNDDIPDRVWTSELGWTGV